MTNLEEFQWYLDHLELYGGGGTDFRPALRRIDELVESGELPHLGGVLYFTDGYGVFPEREPAYPVAFVMLRYRYDDINIPALGDTARAGRGQAREGRRMDIKQAKEEIRRAVLAYTERTPDGALCMPLVHQRPLLLMGPPGVGKTAVFYQLAQELGINLVSYTMTHHTRQSALGLPLIREKTFGGKPYSATEYTMSEILASVYERMEQTGVRTGILFLDEINCVSER